MLRRALIAEFLGSLLLACVVIGSGILAERLAAGNAAMALLGNTLATVAALGVLIVLFGPLSGAQFNPAVSLALSLRGEQRWRVSLAYALLQVAAMVLGAWFAHAMFGLPILQWSQQVRGSGGERLGECIATFWLLLTIFGTAHGRAALLPLTVPAAIAAGYWFTSSTSFANPAITVARAMTATFSGIRPEDVAGFVLAQGAGALVACAVAASLFPSDHGGRR
jgi:glycerol uptake facilitator-like aquaporin